MKKNGILILESILNYFIQTTISHSLSDILEDFVLVTFRSSHTSNLVYMQNGLRYGSVNVLTI